MTKSNTDEYYRSSMIGMIFMAWDHQRKKGRSKHSLNIYHVLGISHMPFSTIYFKKLVRFIMLLLFQNNETESQSGQNAIPKNT